MTRGLSAAAAGLVLVSAAAFTIGLRSMAADRAHVAASTLVEATVTSVDDMDGTLRVRMDRQVEDLPTEVTVDTVERHDRGTTVLLRVDATDPSWTHLAAERPDPTWWLTLGGGGLLLAAVFAERVMSGRRSTRALQLAEPTRGIPVRYLRDPDDVGVLLCVDEDLVFAEMPLDERMRLATVEDRVIPHPRNAILVGDLRNGGWAALVDGAELMPAAAPVEAAPGLLPLDSDLIDRDPEDLTHWTREVPFWEGVEPSLPLAVGPPSWHRVAGAALAVAAAIAPWFVFGWDPSWHLLVVGGLVAGEGIFAGVGWLVGGATASEAGLTGTGPLLRRYVPWRRATSVRLDGDEVVVLLTDDEVFCFGPFGEAVEDAPEVVRPPTAEALAAGAAVEAAIARSRHGGTEQDLNRRKLRASPGAGLLLAGWLSIAAAALAHLP